MPVTGLNNRMVKFTYARMPAKGDRPERVWTEIERCRPIAEVMPTPMSDKDVNGYDMMVVFLARAVAGPEPPRPMEMTDPPNLNLPMSSGAAPDDESGSLGEEAENLLRQTLAQEDYQRRVGMMGRARRMAEAARRAKDEVDAFDRRNPEIHAQCLRVERIERLSAERAEARRAITPGGEEDDSHPEQGGDALRRTPMDEDHRGSERRGRRSLRDSAEGDAGSSIHQS